MKSNQRQETKILMLRPIHKQVATISFRLNWIHFS